MLKYGMHSTFTFGDILRLTGAQRTQLIYWTQAGLITAGIRAGDGPGHHRVFNYRDVVEVAVATALGRHGVKLPTIRAALKAARVPRRPPRAPMDRVVYVLGDPEQPAGIWVGTREAWIAELRTPTLTFGPAGIFVDVGRIVERLDQQTGRAP